MFDPITLALIGSAVGGLTNKKNPLKGALIGGGLGYGGGLLAAPSAVGAAGAEGFAGLGGAGGSGLADGVPGFVAQPTAFQNFMGYAKPVGEAASAANAVHGLLGSSQPLPPSPITPPQPNGNLNQIVAGNNQQSQFLQQQSEQERARRMALLGRIGGHYGSA